MRLSSCLAFLEVFLVEPKAFGDAGLKRRVQPAHLSNDEAVLIAKLLHCGVLDQLRALNLLNALIRNGVVVALLRLMHNLSFGLKQVGAPPLASDHFLRNKLVVVYYRSLVFYFLVKGHKVV